MDLTLVSEQIQQAVKRMIITAKGADELLRVKTIRVHHKPHADEMIAHALLALVATEWSDLSGVSVDFVDAGWQSPDGRNAIQLLQDDGILCLGVGGALFDEHPTEQNARQLDECTTTLVASWLGLRDYKPLEAILQRTLQDDTQGQRDPFSLSRSINVMSEQGIPYAAILNFVTHWLAAKVSEQTAFYHAENALKVDLIRVEQAKLNGRSISIGLIHSDNDKVSQFGRSGKAGEARLDMVVQRWTTGHVTITANGFDQETMGTLLRLIRGSEMIANGFVGEVKDLGQEKGVPGADNWYYPWRAETDKPSSIMNGGPRASNSVEPTKLKDDKIMSLVQDALNPQAFAPDRATICRLGACSSTQEQPCEWGHMALARCLARHLIPLTHLTKR